MSRELPFDPMPFIKGSFSQTLFGAYPNLIRGPTSHTKFILLPDRDYLALEVTTPKLWKKNDLTVLMLHGLCGSHKSPTLVRLSKKLENKNIRSIRLNLRGCGSGKGKARKIYHAGQSEDIFEALKHIYAETPDSQIIILGFSLGGNIALKLAAELSLANLRIVKKVLAINPPIDLFSSVMLLAERKNRVYEKYFLKLLKQDCKFRHKKFQDFRKIDFPRNVHLHDFDKLYTVPEYGFKDIFDYYKRASSRFLIPAIKFETNILFSEDDPIVKSHDFEGFVMPSNVNLYKTKHGGHVGYVAFPGKSRGVYWLDNILLDWIFE